MLQLTSPRLPGVPLLHAQYTGSEYSRWRRSIKFALEAKGTWKYCNGQATMPMPSSPTASTANLQPSLLEERREWVKHDREVKLDIFLSLAEEVMLELFEVGPPLPPSSMNAQEMLEALEERFAVFKFEAYHHAFCHFLNLHIDQYASIEDFNREFLTTLEDLLDHGHQNPWVAKKLEEWDTQSGQIDCIEILRESPPWSIIRPLAPKASQNFQVESIPEEYLEGSSASDSDMSSEKSDASTVSSMSSHSRNVSANIADTTPSLDVVEPRRQLSILTTKSQEITVCASPEAIAELNSQAVHKENEGLPTSAIPERGSSKNQVPGTSLSDDPGTPLPEWLASKKSVARRPPPPNDRPLPPLPIQAQQTNDKSKSAPPKVEPNNITDASKVSLTTSTRKTPPTPSTPPTSLKPTSRRPPSAPNTAINTKRGPSRDHHTSTSLYLDHSYLTHYRHNSNVLSLPHNTAFFSRATKALIRRTTSSIDLDPKPSHPMAFDARHRTSTPLIRSFVAIHSSTQPNAITNTTTTTFTRH
jgi:hypothetical protein